MSVSGRRLIVNADDFGQSDGINTGVIAGFERGLVTSASLMVRFSSSAAAADYAQKTPDLSVGLHFDTGEWTFSEGEWTPIYTVVDLHDEAALSKELSIQLELFTDLVGRPPTHIDSHQHVHLTEPLRSLSIAAADRLGVPLRSFSDRVNYCGSFYGQSAEGYPVPDAISLQGFAELLETLSPGTTELGCHPAEFSDIETMYRNERLVELGTLCDPRARSAVDLADIGLCSFHDVLGMEPM